MGICPPTGIDVPLVSFTPMSDICCILMGGLRGRIRLPAYGVLVADPSGASMSH